MQTQPKSSAQAKGIAMVMLSAVIYGFTPVVAALSYAEGNNGIQMAFLRALLPIPVLIVLCLRYPKPNRHQLLMGIFAGILSFGCTMMLYSSYAYLSVGVATTLHFLYPLYVALYQAIFRKKPLGWQRIVGLLLAVPGMAFFLEKGAALDPVGILLAVGSGVVYAAYIILLEKEAREPLPVYQLMLIISCVGVVMCGAFGLLTRSFCFTMSGKGWLCTVVAAYLVVFFACTLFQRGVRLIGGTNTAVFSLLEPIMSIVFSIWLMGDTFTWQKGAGCGIILVGLLLTALAKPKE